MNNYLYIMDRMTTEADILNIKAYVEHTIDMNPDKGLITAVKEACEFYDVIATETEIETIAFNL